MMKRSKVSRRDFLKLFLVAAGTGVALFLQKRAQPVTEELDPTPTPFHPAVAFMQWGQGDLVFDRLIVPYQDLG